MTDEHDKRARDEHQVRAMLRAADCLSRVPREADAQVADVLAFIHRRCDSAEQRGREAERERCVMICDAERAESESAMSDERAETAGDLADAIRADPAAPISTTERPADHG